MNPPGKVASSELIGRRLFGSRSVGKGSGRIHHRAFLNTNSLDLSVDRNQYAPPEFLKAIAEQNGRDRKLSFNGWGVLSAEDASETGCSVRACPNSENPFHAEIRLPESMVAKDDRVLEAKRLARQAVHRDPDRSPRSPRS